LELIVRLPLYFNATAILMKRLTDIIISALLLVLFSPILLVVVVLIRVKIGSPVMFNHLRPGFHAVPFRMYKFRTMTDEKDANGELLPDADRLCRTGALLRSTSLDEFPALINVLKGEMSLVGPRPLLMKYLDLYNSEQFRRHNVLPGITGWAQVNGRNALSWEEKFQYDVWYVDNVSYLLDLKILWKTIAKVLARDGITEKGGVSMVEFSGAPEESIKGG